MEYKDDYSFSYSYLTPGEAVLWKGRPQSGHLLTSQDIVMIPFSILWCGFAIFWVCTAFLNGAPIPFVLFGVPFVFVGLYIVFGRFIHTAYLRKRTYYVITNLKIIRKRGQKIDMQDRATLPPLQIRVHPDGSGTISFGMPYGNVYSSRQYRGVYPGFSLDNIPDVARVHALLINRNDH